ncbi:MAG: cyclase [Candidatus Krumholzibacteriia bacterium]
MLTQRIIPCLDICDGRVVKGIRFQNLRDSGDPVERAQVYAAAGADELVMLDVSATPEGRGTAIRTVEAVRKVLTIPLTVGGGVRTLADAQTLLAAGADKVSLNTAAVETPQVLTDIAEQLGRQCTVLAVDAARRESGSGWEVVIRSGKQRTGLDVLDWIEQAVARGAGEVLLTSFDRDGTRLGYDTDLLSAAAARVPVPIIASGGASEPSHLVAAIEAGASAVLAATIFHENEITISDLKIFLAKAGMEVRPC